MRKLKGHGNGSVAKVISVQEDLYLDPQNPMLSCVCNPHAGRGLLVNQAN